MTIMIALVSDQRMQNVLPVFQQGANYSTIILLLSKERHSQKPHQRYLASAEDLRQVFVNNGQDVIIAGTFLDPFSIDTTRNDIFNLISQLRNAADLPESIVVNISGGTKPMAIGALQAAQTAALDCVYTDTENNELIWLSPDGTVKTQRLEVANLDVAKYLRSYGATIASAQRVQEIDPRLVSSACKIAEYHPIFYQPIIQSITNALKAANYHLPVCCQLPHPPTRRQRELIVEFAELDIWQWAETNAELHISQRESAAFLNGGWVELCVANQLVNSQYFDEVLINVTLDGIEGEIDVVAVSKGKLILIECKSNVQRSEQLSKLDSFRKRLGGPFAKAYYVRASEAYAKPIRNQARKFQLNEVFLGKEIHTIGKSIGKTIGVLG